MMETIVNVLGWAGSILLISAYFLLSSGKLKAESVWYQVFNVFGSIFLVINTYYYGAIPSTVVNVIWVGIGGYFLLRIMKP